MDNQIPNEKQLVQSVASPPIEERGGPAQDEANQNPSGEEQANSEPTVLQNAEKPDVAERGLGQNEPGQEGQTTNPEDSATGTDPLAGTPNANSSECRLVALLWSDNQLFIRESRVGDDKIKKALEETGQSQENGSAPSLHESSASNEGELTTGSSTQRKIVALYDLGDGSIGQGSYAPWYEKRGAIKTVLFGTGVKPRSMAQWFYGLDKLESIEFGSLDTSEVVDMASLFSDCSALSKLDLSDFKTGRVTNMSHMFAGCSSIEKLDLTSFDTSSVKSMSAMFSGSKSLKSVDLSKFNTSNVTDMTDMFSNCASVTMLDLSSFKTTSLKSNSGMFLGCTSLAALDVQGFTADQLSTASIPVDNKGGFWRLNVPQGYDTGVVLREPSPEERTAAGIIDDNGNGNGGGNENGNGSSSENGKSNQNENGNQGNNPVDNGGSKGEQTDDPKPDPSGNEKEKAGTSEESKNEQVSTRVDVAAVSPSEVAETTDVIVSSVVESTPLQVPIGLIDNFTSALNQFTTPFAQVVSGSAFVPPDIAGVTETVLQTIGVNVVVDKTMAMLVAAIGMILAAGLLLTLCFKIR